MALQIGTRPASLDGCWKTWSETDLDVVARTDFESGNVRTRRRFTGVQTQITASVTLHRSKHADFMTWWRVNQRQGAIGTMVIDPTGAEIVVQWSAPPQIAWGKPGDNTFTATVQMFIGADF